MEGEIMIVTIVAIGCLTGVITTWIQSRKKSAGYDEETFERLAKAFMKFKKDAEKRIQNLEAIIAEEDNSSSPSQIEEPRSTIEIEDEEERESKTGNGNLSNMLRE